MKKTRPSPDLAAWQEQAIEVVARSPLSRELVFSGGAALAAIHLHHRLSADLDFFLEREVELPDVVAFFDHSARALTRGR